MDLTRPIAPEPYSLLPRVPSFTLTSTDIADGEPLAPDFVLAEGNTSPHLRWSGFPRATRSFLLTCFDPDAPTPAGYWHWAVADLDVTQTELERGAGESDITLHGAAFHLKTDGGAHAYEGAAPPAGDRAHRYVFAVHALDVDTLGIYPDYTPTKASFVALFHTLARATLTPVYSC